MKGSKRKTTRTSRQSKIIGQNINPSQFGLTLWQVTDLADFLGLAVKTVYNKVNKGEIPCYKRGKFLYFIPSEIITWLMVGGRR